MTKRIPLSSLFTLTEKYLNKRYEIYRDSILNKLNIRLKGGDRTWQPLNLDALFVELHKNYIPISKANLNCLFKTDFIPTRCPFTEYFENLPKWDGKDHIEMLANHINTSDQVHSNNHFKKWLVRTVKCAIIDKYYHPHALILSNSHPGSGKSSFCEFICPPKLAEYFKKDVQLGTFSINPSLKKHLCQNFLMKLKTLPVINTEKISTLEHFINQEEIYPPHNGKRKYSPSPRTCSIIGVSNERFFLDGYFTPDRWIVISVLSIDPRYRDTIDIDSIWSQAYALSQDPEFDSERGIELIESESGNLISVYE